MNELLHSLMLTLHLITEKARNILGEKNMNKQEEREETDKREQGERKL